MPAISLPDARGERKSPFPSLELNGDVKIQQNQPVQLLPGGKFEFPIAGPVSVAAENALCKKLSTSDLIRSGKVGGPVGEIGAEGVATSVRQFEFAEICVEGRATTSLRCTQLTLVERSGTSTLVERSETSRRVCELRQES